MVITCEPRHVKTCLSAIRPDYTQTTHYIATEAKYKLLISRKSVIVAFDQVIYNPQLHSNSG